MPQKNDQNDSTADVSRHAAYWCLRLKDPRRFSLAEGLQFLAWLARARHHVDEFLFLRRLDDRMTRLLRAKRDQSNVTHVNFWRGSSLYQPETPARRHVGGWNIAVMILVMLPAIFLLATLNEEPPGRTVTTTAHESKTRQLEDGSLVSLRSSSTLRVEFTDLRRDVHLSRGQATFDVVMDMKRPFVVSTAMVDIAAVESKFSVNIDSGVEVMVYEGIVAISGRGTKAGAPVVTVKKGERYRVSVEGFGVMVADVGAAVRAARVDG